MFSAHAKGHRRKASGKSIGAWNSCAPKAVFSRILTRGAHHWPAAWGILLLPKAYGSSKLWARNWHGTLWTRATRDVSWSPSTKCQHSPNLNTRQKNLHFKGTCMARESLHLESKGLWGLSLQDNQPLKHINLHQQDPSFVWEGRNRGDRIDPASEPRLHQVSKCQHSCWGHDVLQEATSVFLSFSKWMFLLGFPATPPPLFSERELNWTCKDTVLAGPRSEDGRNNWTLWGKANNFYTCWSGITLTYQTQAHTLGKTNKKTNQKLDWRI